MGTNYVDFVREAHRVLKEGGELKVAEVISRFSDVDAFIELMDQLGFEMMDKVCHRRCCEKQKKLSMTLNTWLSYRMTRIRCLYYSILSRSPALRARWMLKTPRCSKVLIRSRRRRSRRDWEALLQMRTF